MPPQKKPKSPKAKREDAENRKRVLLAQEKILATKRMLLSLVEKMIEKDVSKMWFLDNCTKLCHADYDDVVQERNIEHLCGYPLCLNIIKQTLKQKYQISLATNKVYDLTERKCYCSNQCYKASKYLKTQLSPIPLYMRKEEKIKIHLLSDSNNKGSAGEEIVFQQTISQEEIEKVYNVTQTSNNMYNMLNEELKKCADSLSDLQIKEHVFEKQYVFGEETPKKSEDSLCDNKSESESDNDVGSDDDDEDEKLFPSYDNIAVLSHKHMPVPTKTKKSVLIPPLKTETTVRSPKQQLSTDFVFKVFKDWMTEDTLKYLLGEKYVYGIKADHLLKNITSTEPINSEKLLSMKNEYINLCLKIDSLPDDDIDGDLNDSIGFDIACESKPSPISKQAEENATTKKIFKRRAKDKSKMKSKNVSFALETKSSLQENVLQCEIAKDTIEDEAESENRLDSLVSETKFPVKEIISQCEVMKDVNEDEGKSKRKHVSFAPEVKCLTQDVVSQNGTIKETLEVEDKVPEDCPEEPGTEISLPEPAFPLVDSVAQNVLRRQVLINHLKSEYSELLPVIGLHYTDVREAIRKYVETLSLTPKNIIFKPKEWKLISLVLYRILTKTVIKNLLSELQFLKLCEDPLIPISIDLIKLEKIVEVLLSADNIIKVK